jgi:hypothetical protein
MSFSADYNGKYAKWIAVPNILECYVAGTVEYKLKDGRI